MDKSTTLFMNLIVKKSLPFHIPLFWILFIVKKRHHRNKYLGQLILNLYATSKYLYKNNSMMLIHSIKHFFAIKSKKEQAINLCWKYFNFYDPLYYNNKKEQVINLCWKYFNSYDPLYHNNQKGTSNKFVLEIFQFLRSLIL